MVDGGGRSTIRLDWRQQVNESWAPLEDSQGFLKENGRPTLAVTETGRLGNLPHDLVSTFVHKWLCAIERPEQFGRGGGLIYVGFSLDIPDFMGTLKGHREIPVDIHQGAGLR
jgi:hypothetical protein